MFVKAIVTGAEPLKLEPLKPVPIVSVLVVDAVTVVVPPNDTKLPLMVMELLVSEPLPMLVSVLFAPLIVLLVSVCEPVNETASVMPYPAIVVGVDVMDDHAGVTVVLLAAVSWPWALTVKMPTWVAEPYVPAVTAVLANEIVPDDVIGPPVRPVPVSISVTVPPATADAVLMDVIRPKASTVTTGIAIVEPKVPVDVPVAIKLMVGLPAEASPFATSMLPVVPTIDLDVNAPPLTPKMPVELDVD